MSTFRKPLLSLLLTLPCLIGMSQWSNHAHAGALPIVSEEEYRTMSPTERKEFEQKIKEQIEQMSPAEQEAYMQEVVERVFENLKPEQQKEVLDEVERVNKMSEDEQRAYFKQVEQDLERAFGKQEQPAPKKKPEPKPEPKVEKKDVVPVEISVKEKALKEAIKLINEVTQAIDDLIVKIEEKEDFLFKVSTWGKKKKIKPWDGGFKWDTLKAKIDTLRGSLDKLKDRDPKTKKHKYLPGFIDDKKLYTTVYNLSVDLADHEPAVRSGKGVLLPRPARGRSHKALKALINVFVELLFPKKPADDLILSLDKLFAQYESEAKKILAEEKEAARRAREESKRPTPPSRVQIAGRRPDYEPTRPDFHEGPDLDFGVPGGYEPGYRPPSGEFEPSGRVTKPEPASKDKVVTPPAKKPEKSKKEGEEEKKKNLQKDERLNKFLQRFDRNIEVVLDTILDNPNFEKLESYLTTNSVDINLARRDIPNLNKFIRKVIADLERMKSRLGSLPSDSQKSYKKDIKGLTNSIKGDLEKLARSIEKIGTARQALLSADIKWAHFALPKPQPGGLSSDVQALTSPTTLPMLKESAREFLKKAREFVGR